MYTSELKFKVLSYEAYSLKKLLNTTVTKMSDCSLFLLHSFQQSLSFLKRFNSMSVIDLMLKSDPHDGDV